MVVLDRRVYRLGGDAHALADVQVQTLLLLFGAGNPYVRQGVRIKAVFGQTRIAHALGRHSARTHHAHIGALQASGAHAAVQDGAHLRLVVRNLHAQRLHAGKEPVDMRIQAKESALPHAHHVIGHVRSGKAPIEQRNLGFGQRYIGTLGKGATAVQTGGGRRGGKRHGKPHEVNMANAQLRPGCMARLSPWVHQGQPMQQRWTRHALAQCFQRPTTWRRLAGPCRCWAWARGQKGAMHPCRQAAQPPRLPQRRNAPHLYFYEK
ncbi:hypothetical protein D3C72_1516050 [compost metagenome]